jgi:hypothetical protein
MIERQEGLEGGFRRTTVMAVAAVAALLAAASLYFGVQPQLPIGARATTSESPSAVGFRALAELLEDLGFTVARNRYRRGFGDVSDALVIIPAPRNAGELSRALERLGEAHAILVVAPKRTEAGRITSDGWLTAAETSTVPRVRRALLGANRAVGVNRRDEPAGTPAINALTVAPSIDDLQQASVADAWPVVAYGAGKSPFALVAELQAQSPRIWLLADPDPLSNHGIDEGSNALFATRLIETLAPPSGAILFDEVHNGGLAAPSVLAMLFRLPWLAVSLAVAALIALIGLSASGRFGTPKEEAVGMAAGRAALIGATTRLQLGRGSGRVALERYMRRTLRLVAQRRHAPDGDDRALAAWLDAVAQREDGGKALDLLTEASRIAENPQAGEAQVLAAAGRIHHWRVEMLNEHRERSARPDPVRGR